MPVQSDDERRGPEIDSYPLGVPPLVRWWEARPAWQQAVVAFPTLAVLFFLLNLGPFSQPLWRSILYGLLEGGFFATLVLAATAQEKARRR